MRRLSLLSLVVSLALGSCGEVTPDSDYVDRMTIEHANDEPVPSRAALVEPSGEVVSEDVAYADLDGTVVHGYLARSKSAGPLPGVVVIQEWWGLNDNIRAMTDRLAGEGYVALAVDLYEGEVAENRDEARQLVTRSMERRERLEENLRQAVSYLRETRGLSRVGVIGWCFGGGWSLRTALLVPEQIDAAVIYYGRLVTEASELESLQAPILGLFGELDRGIPVTDVRAFEAALESLGKEAAIHVYDDADHAFANPSGTRYNETAASDAWEKTIAFFARHL